MKQKIKVKFTDVWPRFFTEIPILDILKKHYDVELSEEPDFLFYSHKGTEHYKYPNCVKIFYAGEYIVPDFNECDYGIGYDYISFGDRYLRYNFSYSKISMITNVRNHFNKNGLLHRKFCNFVYSNEWSKGTEVRKKFCQKLMEYKKVDCPGMVLNNMSDDELVPGDNQDWYDSKLEFIKKYKFTIAFENYDAKGYTTEKLIQAFQAASIPIYWGNEQISKMFNPSAFVNCHDYKNFDEVIKRVEEIDKDDELYWRMMNEPLFVTPEQKIDYDKALEDFIINIIAKGNKPFNKDVLTVSSTALLKHQMAQKYKKEKLSLRKRFFSIEKTRKNRNILHLLGLRIKF